MPLENRLDFTNLKDLLSLEWEVTREGVRVSGGRVDSAALDVPPHEERPLPVSIPVPADGRCYVTFTLVQEGDRPFTPAGHVLGFEQIELRPFVPGRVRPRSRDNPRGGNRRGGDPYRRGFPLCLQ